MTAYFITLTYNTDHVPISENGYMTLHKPDVQKFFKRLRKFSNPGIKYYLCGEYGTQKMRPHYHIILFNADLETLISLKWANFAQDEPATYLNGKYEFKSSLWQSGHMTIGTVTEASIGYTLQYIEKPRLIPMHKKDDRQREFSLMSKGLGKSYINEKNIEWHKDWLTNRMYLPLMDGKKAALPRYYKEKIYTDQEREIIATHIVNIEIQENYDLSLKDHQIRREKRDKQRLNNEQKIKKVKTNLTL